MKVSRCSSLEQSSEGVSDGASFGGSDGESTDDCNIILNDDEVDSDGERLASDSLDSQRNVKQQA